MCEMLWSDPQEDSGRTPNKRGVGIAFGECASQQRKRCSPAGMTCTQAAARPSSPLGWGRPEPSKRQGRMQLFVGSRNMHCSACAPPSSCSLHGRALPPCCVIKMRGCLLFFCFLSCPLLVSTWAVPEPPPCFCTPVPAGGDVTRRFLEDNGLQLLVRSHEVKEEGYEVAHDGYCVTIFSAPNYCDQMGNKVGQAGTGRLAQCGGLWRGGVVGKARTEDRDLAGLAGAGMAGHLHGWHGTPSGCSLQLVVTPCVCLMSLV